MRVIVDTNVVLRFMEVQHDHHQLAVDAMQSLREAGSELCLVPQIHYEFWVVSTRPLTQNGLGMSAAEAEKSLGRLTSPLFRILRDERAIYGYWRDLVGRYAVQGKAAHDARLVAAMLRHGVCQILTFNTSDFSRYSEIEVIDPNNHFA
jgi:predicted nucleic acid-binding protein